MSGTAQEGHNKKSLWIVVLLITIAVLGSAIAIVAHLFALRESEARFIHYNGAKYRYRDDIHTMLVIGIDDNDAEEEESMDSYNRNSGQADFLLLVVFNDSAESYRAIQINRDTMTAIRTYDIVGDYAGTSMEQIAFSHTYGDGGEGSCEDTAYAVSELLFGVDIDNYISITTDVVPVLNDMAGGVDVLIEDDFSGVDDTLTIGETVHLQGEHALVYIRARRDMPDDNSNESRMRRQYTYLYALEDALRNAFSANPLFAVEAYESVADHTVTNIDIADIPALGYELANYEFEGIVSIEGEQVMGEQYLEFYADEESLQELVVSMFYEPV